VHQRICASSLARNSALKRIIKRTRGSAPAKHIDAALRGIDLCAPLGGEVLRLAWRGNVVR